MFSLSRYEELSQNYRELKDNFDFRLYEELEQRFDSSINTAAAAMTSQSAAEQEVVQLREQLARDRSDGEKMLLDLQRELSLATDQSKLLTAERVRWLTCAPKISVSCSRFVNFSFVFVFRISL